MCVACRDERDGYNHSTRLAPHPAMLTDGVTNVTAISLGSGANGPSAHTVV